MDLCSRQVAPLRKGEENFPLTRLQNNRLHTVESLFLVGWDMFLPVVTWKLLRLRVRNRLLCSVAIRYVKSLWIWRVTMRYVRYLVRRVKKWRKDNNCQGLPVHRINPARISPPAPLKTRMLVRTWQVNCHNPRSGHCHSLPPKACSKHLYSRGRGVRWKSSESGRSFGQSIPLSFLLVFFAGIVTLLVVETNSYFQEYLYIFDHGLSSQPEDCETKNISVFWLWHYRWTIYFVVDWGNPGRNWSRLAAHFEDKLR